VLTPGALPALTIEQMAPLTTLPRPADEGPKFRVKSLQLTGAQMFTPASLLEACGFRAGRAYTLAELRAMAQSIERYYQDRGYPVAQAYLPAQDSSDGVVTIAVSEGRYGQVLVRNQSRVAAPVLADGLQDIKTGALVVSAPLEHQLLLLSDLPGVQITSALVPGTTFGTSDLLVDVLPTRRVTGSVDIDNAGNYYTGALRVGATLFLNEPTGEGDVASLRLLSSGDGFNYVRTAYHLQLGPTRVGAALSNMEYALGQELENLQANGTARSLGFFGSYPLLRARPQNLYFGASFESKRFEDRLDSVGAITEKSAHVFTASLTGDQRDRLGGRANSAFSLALSTGTLTILTSAARSFDTSTAQSNGHFSKLGFNASRLQNLSSTFALYAAINGQVASKNLDSSEKMALGGMFAVRAYPEGEAYGDEGYVLNVEARWLLPRPWRPAAGQLQLVGFVDTGRATLNKNPWSTEPNQRRLSGTGLGLHWSTPDKSQVRLVYAHTLGDEPARAAPEASERLWFQGVAYF
jgi:hemolysin activation/secretion protein